MVCRCLQILCESLRSWYVLVFPSLDGYRNYIDLFAWQSHGLGVSVQFCLLVSPGSLQVYRDRCDLVAWPWHLWLFHGWKFWEYVTSSLFGNDTHSWSVLLLADYWMICCCPESRAFTLAVLWPMIQGTVLTKQTSSWTHQNVSKWSEMICNNPTVPKISILNDPKPTSWVLPVSMFLPTFHKPSKQTWQIPADKVVRIPIHKSLRLVLQICGKKGDRLT